LADTDDISTKIRVQISPVTSSDADPDVSDDNFTIRGTLNLTQPSDAGFVWQVGQSYYINWTRSSATMGNVSLSYSANSGGDGYPYPIASNISSANLSYYWPIPDAMNLTGQPCGGYICNQMKVKITLMDNPEINDTSENTFYIVRVL